MQLEAEEKSKPAGRAATLQLQGGAAYYMYGYTARRSVNVTPSGRARSVPFDSRDNRVNDTSVNRGRASCSGISLPARRRRRIQSRRIRSLAHSHFHLIFPRGDQFRYLPRVCVYGCALNADFPRRKRPIFHASRAPLCACVCVCVFWHPRVHDTRTRA